MHEPDGYLSTDERDDVIASLEHLRRCLITSQTKSEEWKWAILAAHAALCGALVCVTAGTAQVGCLSDKSRARMIAWLHSDFSAPRPPERLAEPAELLRRACSRTHSDRRGPPLRISVNVLRDLARLHEFRNQLMHFRPLGWSIELAGLPRMIGRAVDVAARLMRSIDVAHQLPDEQLRRLDAVLEQVHSLLSGDG